MLCEVFAYDCEPTLEFMQGHLFRTISVVFGLRAPVPGYRMDGYVRASGFVFCPNKHDCSRCTWLRGKFNL